MAKKIKKEKKLTKKKLASMARTAKRKQWEEVARQVKERDGNVCVICKQPHKMLNVHHLIIRQVKEFMFDVNNLISLCPKHHKFSFTESFHRSPFWSVKWMIEHRKWQFDWVMSKISIPTSPSINPSANQSE